MVKKVNNKQIIKQIIKPNIKKAKLNKKSVNKTTKTVKNVKKVVKLQQPVNTSVKCVKNNENKTPDTDISKFNMLLNASVLIFIVLLFLVMMF